MSVMQVLNEATTNPSTASNISEFIFPGESRQQFSLVLPVLSHLSRCGDSRWLTCIGTTFLAKKDCAEFGLDWRRLLQVLPSARCDVFELALRALVAGKSHTVVCVIPLAASQQQLHTLEQAARVGGSRCILIRCR